MNNSAIIHPTAIIAEGARIGASCEIGPYSVIGPDVELGTGCWIGSHVVLEGRTSLGSHCSVFQFASVGAPPQDKKYQGEASRLVIGSNNIIREYVTLQPGTAGGVMETVLGDGNLFMACSHVAHDCLVGNNNVFANGATLAGHVIVGNHTTVGGLAAIHQFVRVGDYAMLGGGAMVAKDIPPYCIAQGDRAGLVGINRVGLERQGVLPEVIEELRACYRFIFRNTEGTLQDRLTTARSRYSQPLALDFLNFIASSERGVAGLRRE